MAWCGHVYQDVQLRVHAWWCTCVHGMHGIRWVQLLQGTAPMHVGLEGL
jgi:hypothetical protein